MTDIFSGELLVGEIDSIEQRPMKNQDGQKVPTWSINLLVTQEGRRRFEFLILPDATDARQLKKGDHVAVPVRTYWSTKHGQLRRQVLPGPLMAAPEA